tara:strand:- start:1840 stop:2004 length:165 start_codon:yes stop_codon:yes gene_type:complete
VGIKDKRYRPAAIENVKKARINSALLAKYLLKSPSKQNIPTIKFIPPYNPATSE